MANLSLSGSLNLVDTLDLVADDGAVLVEGVEVLVERQPGDHTHGHAPPVVLPPPPASPIDPETDVCVVSSMQQTVTAAGRRIVALGMVLQGGTPMWPGMVLPSQLNLSVTIHGTPINVEGDQVGIFPSGAIATLTASGQDG